MGKGIIFGKGKKKRMTFERGTIYRARRDVLAGRLAVHRKVKAPYAMATSMVKRGVRVPNHEVRREFAEQMRMKKRR